MPVTKTPGRSGRYAIGIQLWIRSVEPGSSHAVFIPAAIGAAVGTGTFRRFPALTGQNDGGPVVFRISLRSFVPASLSGYSSSAGSGNNFRKSGKDPKIFLAAICRLWLYKKQRETRSSFSGRQGIPAPRQQRRFRYPQGRPAACSSSQPSRYHPRLSAGPARRRDR